MILKNLRLSHFGKFHDKEVAIKPGLNIIYGKNEAGKSTIHSFIRGMLFGIDRQRGRASKDDVYTRYLPWVFNGQYDGCMDIIAGNKEYRLIRNFVKTNREFRIIDLSTGKDVDLVYKDIQDIIPGLTESLFRNTVSIEQLRTGTDDELVMQVKNYMANLSVSKTNEVDVPNALSHLSAKKKELQSKLNLIDTEDLSRQLEKRLDDLNEVDELNERLVQLETLEKELREQKEAFLSDDEKVWNLNAEKTFHTMLSKFREYMELKQECENLQQKYDQLTKYINELFRVENSHKSIHIDVEEVNDLNEKIRNLQSKLSQIRMKEEEVTVRNKLGKKIFYFVPLFIISAVCTAAVDVTIGVSMGILVLIGLLLLIFYRQLRTQKKLSILEKMESDVGRKCIEYEAKKREIYLRNGVTGESEFKYKMSMLKENQEESQQYKQQRNEIERQHIRTQSQVESLEKDISQFAKHYFSTFEINDDLLHDIEYEVNLRKLSVEKDYESLSKEYNNTVVQLERVKWEASKYVDLEEEIQHQQNLYDEAIENKEKLEKELKAVILAIEAIETLSIDIHDSFGDQINERLSCIVEKVTNGRYKEVKMDENLNIKVASGYDYIPFEKLSAGAIAEIYLALRITIADILNGTKNLPLILDDAFVLYDDERLKTTLRELGNIADRQILIFTCHEREQKLLDQLQIEYNYIDL